MTTERVTDAAASDSQAPRVQDPVGVRSKWWKRAAPVIGFLLGALITQVLNTPSTIDLIHGTGLKVTQSFTWSPSADIPVVVLSADDYPRGSKAENLDAVRAAAQSRGVTVFSGVVGLTFTNDAAAQMRINRITLLPLSGGAQNLDEHLVVSIPQGGGGDNTLALWANFDRPRDSLKEVKDEGRDFTSDDYFRSASIPVDPGTSFDTYIYVRAQKTSGSFALKISYLLHGANRSVETPVLGTITGPRCDEHGNLSYSHATIADVEKLYDASPSKVTKTLVTYQSSPSNYGC